jgi:hypothetical protein
MSFEVLILNSGEWVLTQELPAAPWHVLVYAQRGAPRNELHVWLPRQDAPRSGDYAFKRYWERSSTRWCVEIPLAAGRRRNLRRPPPRVRFSAPDGRVLWAENPGGLGLGDLSDADLGRLLHTGVEAPFCGA